MSILKRKTWIILILGIFMMPVVQGQEMLTLDEIVAKVNNEIITLTDLQKEMEFLESGLAEQIQDAEVLRKEFDKRKVFLLKNLIENKMMLQRAEELGLSANVDVDVSVYLEETRKQNGIPNMEVFDQVLRQKGSSLAEYRETVKKNLIIESLISQFVYSKITLLTPEIEAYYEENQDRFTEPAEVELAEILLLKEGKDPEQIRQRAQQVLQRLRAGESFEDLAREFSDGPTASRGGHIGVFKKDSMNEALENVAFSLEPGQSSSIIETDYGLQIIKVIDRKTPRVNPLEEVRRDIQQFMYRQKAQPQIKEFLEDLRSQSYVYVAPKYKDQFDLEGVY